MPDAQPSDLMECYTCRQEEPLLYHVKLRGDVETARAEPAREGGPDSVAYRQYVQELTYRSAFVCHACYQKLDSPDGTAEISGRNFGIAGQSRRCKAVAYTSKKYRAFQERQAKRLGLPDL